MSRKTRRTSALTRNHLMQPCTGPRATFEALERRSLLSAVFGDAFALGGGADSAAEAAGVATDAAGNLYVAGTFSDSIDFDPDPNQTLLLHSAGYVDAFVAKYDPAGTLVWVRQMGGDGTDNAFGVAVDGSGNVYVTGSHEGTAHFGSASITSTGWTDAYVTKLDNDGTFLWADSLSDVTYSGVGSDIAVDQAGNVYTTGSVNLDWPINSLLVTKHNADGQREWFHKIGSSNADGFGIAVDAAGNSFITGHYFGQVDFDPGPGTFLLKSMTYKSRGWTYTTGDAFVLALDPAGNFRWAASMGSTGDDQGVGIALDGAGNLHVTGQFGAGLFDGKNPPVSGSDFDPGPGVLALSNAGSMDIFVAKLTGSGNLIWAKSMGGPGWDFGYGVTLDSAGDVYLTGGFGYTSGSSAGQTADMDPGPGVYTLSGAGNLDIFVSKLTSSGNFVWAAGMGGAGEEYGQRIAVDSSGSVYTVGGFEGQVDFDPGPGTHHLTANSSSWGAGFVSKLIHVEPPPRLSINDLIITEGNSGTTLATFTITRSGDTSEAVTVDYATANGTAQAGSDYLATAGTLTFAPGETTKTISVMILGDTTWEPDETFFVHLSNISANATLADAEGICTIKNDDSKGSKK